MHLPYTKNVISTASAVRTGQWGSVRICLLACFAAQTASCLTGCAGNWRRPVAENLVSSRQTALRGIEAETHSNWDSAEELYKEAIQKCPANEQARRRYADALWRRGQRADALKQMAEAVRLSGGDPEMTVQLGQMYLAVDIVDHAERLAERVISVDQQRPDAWALRGDIHRRRGDTSEALASYHRALTYRSEFPEVQIAIAEIYRTQGKSRRALATLDTVAETFPKGQTPQRVLQLRGLTLTDLGRHTDAVTSLMAATQAGEPSAELLFQLAEAQIAVGDHAAARQSLTDAAQRGAPIDATQRLLSQLTDNPAQVASTKR